MKICIFSEDYTLQDLLASDQPGPDEGAELESSRALLDEVLASLDQRESFIIRHYFGLEGGITHTLEEIGEQLDVTQERVRQIKEKALGKLSHPSRAKALQLLANEF